MKDTFKLGSYFIFIGFLLLFGPLAIIWALNTLFSLSIAYTWQTWLAVNILGSAYTGIVSK